ncbi:MAG: DUF3052 domain-containing protein [Candidatus Cyclobacteriaceae bacterium M3_2C_046]
MAGYSGTPLVKKLGIKSGFVIQIINEPRHYFDLLENLPEEIIISEKAGSGHDFIHVFTKSKHELIDLLPQLRNKIKPNGIIWISWPKKASGVVTDLSGHEVRTIGLSNNLVDIKVCAIDETWSGLKFVIPRHLRTDENYQPWS